MFRSALAFWVWGFLIGFFPTTLVAQTAVPVPDIMMRAPPPVGDVSLPDIVLVTPTPVGEVAVPDITLVTRPPLGAVSLPPIVLVPLPPVGDIALPDIVLITAPPLQSLAVGVPDIILVTDDDDEVETDDGIGTGGNLDTDSPSPVLDEDTQTTAPTDVVRTWCGGTYSVQLGQPRVIPTGPPIGRVEAATASVSSAQCTSMMNIEVSGMSVAMSRMSGADYVGSVTGDGGQAVTYYLTCNPDLGITGYLQAEDANIKIQRDIDMTRTGGAEPDLSDCPADVGYVVDP